MEGGKVEGGRWECTRPLRSLPLINGCRGTGLAARSLRPVCARLDLKGLGGGKVARTLMLEAPRDLLSHAGARKCTGRPTSETLHAPAQCPSRGSGDSYLLFTRSENDSLASCLLPLASRLLPHASCLTPHASCLTPLASCLTPLASCLTPHASCLLPGIQVQLARLQKMAAHKRRPTVEFIEEHTGRHTVAGEQIIVKTNQHS